MSWGLMIGGLLLFILGFCAMVPSSGDQTPASPGAKRVGRWMIVFGVIGALTGAAVYAETNPPQRKAPIAVPAHTPIEAWTVCQEFVTDRLIAPRSAKYPIRSLSEFVTYKGSGAYRVENYVDSQNANGAMIRTRFTCEVTKEPTRWRLDSLVMK